MRKAFELLVFCLILNSALLPFIKANPSTDFAITLFDVQRNLTRQYDLGETVIIYAQVENTGSQTIVAYGLEGVFTIISPSNSQIDARTHWNIYDIDPGEMIVLEGKWTVRYDAEQAWYDIKVVTTSKDTNLTHSELKNNAFRLYREIVWNTNPIPLPVPLDLFASAFYNCRIYVLGGVSLDENRRDTVYFADILSDGTVGAWGSTTSLPAVRADFRAVVWNDYVYALGGSTTGGVYARTVWCAHIQPDGSLGTWETMTGMPGPVAAHAALVWNDRIYVIGGWNGSWTNEVLFAEINPDGSLGSWNSTTSLPEPRRSLAAVVYDGVVYAIGGQYPAMVYQATVYYATINSDGTVGAWSIANSIPDGREGADAFLHNGNVYVIGGNKRAWEGEVYATVFNATINPDSTVGSWRLETPLPEPRSRPACVVFEGRIHVLGGTGIDECKNTIYYSSPLTVSGSALPYWMQWWFWGILVLAVTAVLLLREYTQQRKAIKTDEPKMKIFTAVSRLDRAKMRFNADVERRRERIQEFEKKHGVRIRRVEDTFEEVLERMGIKRDKEQ